MPEVVVKYSRPETLKLLKAFAKYLDFKILSGKAMKKTKLEVKGATIVLADPSINMSQIKGSLTGQNLEASELRKQAWQRKK